MIKKLFKKPNNTMMVWHLFVISACFYYGFVCGRHPNSFGAVIAIIMVPIWIVVTYSMSKQAHGVSVLEGKLEAYVEIRKKLEEKK